jgi:hypothetical protein
LHISYDGGIAEDVIFGLSLLACATAMMMAVDGGLMMIFFNIGGSDWMWG